MKKILIVGLGLIGASYAEGLNKDYEVYGVDTNSDTLSYAITHNYIKRGSKEIGDFINDVDIIILAIYPDSILDTLKKYSFKENQIITDVSGIKESFVYEATRLAKPAIYCSHHPMAGREKVGIKYASKEIFKNANFLITPTCKADIAISELTKMAKILGFNNIDVITPEYHDKMIGYTSTLTHAIAVALVNSDHFSDTFNFVGDSYRDLTRIAMINSKLWSELFFHNKKNLINHLDEFVKEIENIKVALLDNDEKALVKIFEESSFKRALLENKLKK